MKKMTGLMFRLALLLCCAAARADEIVVQPDATASLTEAVAKARPGDIIHLAAGVYTQETETYPIVIDKPLTLIGEEGAVLESPAFYAAAQCYGTGRR